MTESDIPELEEIRQFVMASLPEGFRLNSVDLTFGSLVEGQEPAFTVLIALSEIPGSEVYGLGDEIASRIRERWSRDDLYIKISYGETSDYAE